MSPNKKMWIMAIKLITARASLCLILLEQMQMLLIALVTPVENWWPCGWAGPYKHPFPKPKSMLPECSLLSPVKTEAPKPICHRVSVWMYSPFLSQNLWHREGLFTPCSYWNVYLTPTRTWMTLDWDWLLTCQPRHEPLEGREHGLSSLSL